MQPCSSHLRRKCGERPSAFKLQEAAFRFQVAPRAPVHVNVSFGESHECARWGGSQDGDRQGRQGPATSESCISNHLLVTRTPEGRGEHHAGDRAAGGLPVVPQIVSFRNDPSREADRLVLRCGSSTAVELGSQYEGEYRSSARKGPVHARTSDTRAQALGHRSACRQG